MGSRLGVLIKSESGWELRYSHWAAQTIGLDIAIDGIEKTLARVAEMSPLRVEAPDRWHSAAYLEGGLVIDHTTKTITWAEETDWEYLPRFVNYLVEHTWPGWKCVWSAEQLYGILRAGGADGYHSVISEVYFRDSSRWWGRPTTHFCSRSR